jgi:hypothetical protein
MSLRCSLLLALLFVGCLPAAGKNSNGGDSPDSIQTEASNEDLITAVPNRPTFSTTAETV